MSWSPRCKHARLVAREVGSASVSAESPSSRKHHYKTFEKCKWVGVVCLTVGVGSAVLQRPVAPQ